MCVRAERQQETRVTQHDNEDEKERVIIIGSESNLNIQTDKKERQKSCMQNYIIYINSKYLGTLLHLLT